MADFGTLTPEQMLQQQQILRQQKMAEMLLQKGMEQPQGQMISGHYVRPSIFQNLAGLANTYVGQQGIEKADQAQLDLAKAIREGQSAAMADYYGELKGRPAVEGGIYNPQGQITKQTTPDMYGADMTLNPQYKQVAPIAEKAPDPFTANLNASINEKLPAFVREHAMKEVTKGPNWAEVSQLDFKTGNTDTYVYDKNSADPKSTMRFVATSKPALTLDQRLSLQDKGINIPTGNAYGGSPVAGGGSMPVAGGGQINPAQPNVKPVSATNVKQPDLVQAFGYDPFKPPPPPAGLPSAEAVRAYRADQFKPLEEGKAKKVNGAAYYQDALDKYLQVINSVELSDLANPQVRKRIDSAYNTAMLTGKNAFDLGVLNGGDERILNSLLPNYKDVSQLLTTKETIKELAQAQKEYGTGVILKEYGSANKPVPEMYRKHIVVPKSESFAAPTKKGGIPAGVTPAEWNAMSPADKKLFE
jgi:hypothetical protein